MWNTGGSKNLIDLADDAVVDISTEKEYNEGCDTCDYYSIYTQQITFKFKNAETFKVNLERKYRYPISEGRLIVILSENRESFKKMTLEEFKKFFSNLEDYLQIKIAYPYDPDEGFSEEVTSFYQLVEDNS